MTLSQKPGADGACLCFTEWWVKLHDVTWRNPEGPGSDVFQDGRHNHPVVQVT